MLDSHSTFDLLFDWFESGSSTASSERLRTILTSMNFGQRDKWLSAAPAHPEALRRWLLGRAFKLERSDSTAVIDIGALLHVIPFLVKHTKPEEWMEQSNNAALAIRCPPAMFKLIEPLQNRPLFRRMLAQARGWHVDSFSRTSYKLEQTFERTWQWPLTVAIYENMAGFDLLSGVRPSGNMFRIVSHREVESAALLIVPGSVEEALGAISNTGPGRYAYVMATGSEGELSDLARLRTKAGAAGTATLGLNRPTLSGLMQWIPRLVDELSLEYAMDEVLQRTLPRGQALLYANPKLLTRSSPREVLHRKVMAIGGLEQLRLDAQLVDSAADFSDGLTRKELLSEFEIRTSSAHFVNLLASINFNALPKTPSSQETRYLTEFERPVLQEAGVEEIAMKYVYQNKSPSEPSHNAIDQLIASTPEKSRVQAQLVSGEKTVSVVPAFTGCAVDIWIGEPYDLSGVAADAPFPAPSDINGATRMTCIFIPLVGCTTTERGQAQRHDVIYSKPLYASTQCRFDIRPAPGTTQFEARILVMYRNKVVQSLMYSAPVGSPDVSAPHPELTAENIVSHNFGAMPPGRDFDFTFVLNHNAALETGITTVGRKSVSFQEPDDNFKLALKAIGNQLNAINTVGADNPADVTSQMQTSLLVLARLGNVLREVVAESMPELAIMTSPSSFDPDKPLRLQIVEAKVGAFIPLELFYDYVAPDDDAKLCAKFVAPGFPSSTCGSCKDRGISQVICPVGFWGLSKVIERRPKAAGLIEDWAQYSISEPSAEKRTLPALNNIVYGISNKVAADDGTAIARLLSQRDPTARQAACWKTWREIIVSNEPTMLVVTGHTQLKNAMAEVEINGQFLSLSQIEQTYVMKPGGVAPVILLLGCETHIKAASIHTLSGRFKNKGAAVVVATLAKIRGNQAPACIAQLTGAFDAAGKASTKERRIGNSTVGFAILKAKQRLLSGGQSIAMSLTAIGDAEWRW